MMPRSKELQSLLNTDSDPENRPLDDRAREVLERHSKMDFNRQFENLPLNEKAEYHRLCIQHLEDLQREVDGLCERNGFTPRKEVTEDDVRNLLIEYHEFRELRPLAKRR